MLREKERAQGLVGSSGAIGCRGWAVWEKFKKGGQIMARKILPVTVMILVFLMAVSGAGLAAENVKIGIVCELSGSGASVGRYWERGVLMGVEAVNEAGGMLGRKVETFTLDTKTEAPVSVAAMKKAIERSPFAVMGTVFSSSTVVNMKVLESAGIPQFTGSTAPPITRQGNLNIFRLNQASDLTMQKLVKWLTDVLKVKKLAIIYATTAFGKGGRDALVNLLKETKVEIVADIATDIAQADFSGELSRVKRSGADTLFLYQHEEANGRILPQIKEMGLDKEMRIVGHDTLLTEDTIKLAGAAANGVQGHHVLSPVAPPLKKLAERYQKKYGETPDHNFFQGYMGIHIIKAVVEEIGAFDQQKFRDYLHNRTLCVKDHPGILMDVYYDEKGDIDRESFLVKVQDQKHVITGILPPLNPEKFTKCKK
jgi:branched-chain amino acid transport system substrate-binding protein